MKCNFLGFFCGCRTQKLLKFCICANKILHTLFIATLYGKVEMCIYIFIKDIHWSSVSREITKRGNVGSMPVVIATVIPFIWLWSIVEGTVDIY